MIQISATRPEQIGIRLEIDCWLVKWGLKRRQLVSSKSKDGGEGLTKFNNLTSKMPD